MDTHCPINVARSLRREDVALSHGWTGTEKQQMPGHTLLPQRRILRQCFCSRSGKHGEQFYVLGHQWRVHFIGVSHRAQRPTILCSGKVAEFVVQASYQPDNIQWNQSVQKIFTMVGNARWFSLDT